MKLESTLRAIAGTFVIASALLARFHSPWWLLFTGFVGLNLLQSAFTCWCPMITFLKLAGMKTCRQEVEAARKAVPT